MTLSGNRESYLGGGGVEGIMGLSGLVEIGSRKLNTDEDTAVIGDGVVTMVAGNCDATRGSACCDRVRNEHDTHISAKHPININAAKRITPYVAIQFFDESVFFTCF